MITLRERNAWDGLTAKLRQFVARRIPDAGDRDDVVQDILLRMWNGLPALRHEERFGPWVYQVARRAVADYWRRRKPVPSANGEAHEEPEVEVNDDAVAQRVAGYLAGLVAGLPSPYREAITLTELEGLTQKEAAAMVGISVPGMKSRVQRGRAMLKRMLLECCQVELTPSGKVVGCVPKNGKTTADRCCAR